jgi:hypothetical protein
MFYSSSTNPSSPIIDAYLDIDSETMGRADTSKHFSELFEHYHHQLVDLKDVGEISTVDHVSSLPRPLKVTQSMREFRPKRRPARKFSTPTKTDLIFAGQLYICSQHGKYPVWAMLVGNRFTVYESYENQTKLLELNIESFVKAIPKSNPTGFTVFLHSQPVLELDADNVVMCLKWTSYITAVSLMNK